MSLSVLQGDTAEGIIDIGFVAAWLVIALPLAVWGLGSARLLFRRLPR